MKLLHLQIITPEETFSEMEVSSAGFPAESGRLTILPDHQSMVCSLAQGETVFKTDGGEQKWNTGPGVLKVFGNSVTVLVHHAALAAKPTAPHTGLERQSPGSGSL